MFNLLKRHILVGLCFSVILIQALAACQANLPYMAQNTTTVPYILAAGDTIELASPIEPDLEGRFVLNDKGDVDLPLIGRVHLEGLTITQADQLITELYGNGYLVNPDITIQMKSYRPFYILGEVESPGQYEYEAGLTLLNAVAIAGGFTYRANQEEFELIRKTMKEGDVETSQKLKIESLGTPIMPGDTIHIKERFF